MTGKSPLRHHRHRAHRVGAPQRARRSRAIKRHPTTSGDASDSPPARGGGTSPP
uniref:Uncharacterized protein n=1 Tax=Arundo donax TaxID=35708 RepID=A0A0A9ATZ2_ARUDO